MLKSKQKFKNKYFCLEYWLTTVVPYLWRHITNSYILKYQTRVVFKRLGPKVIFLYRKFKLETKWGRNASLNRLKIWKCSKII